MPDRLDTLRALAAKGTCALAAAAPVVTRLVLGQMLYFSGHGKLEHLPGIVEQFTKWGVPLPGLVAPVTATIELIGGLMLFFGLGTRIASLLLIGVLCGALSTAHAGQLSTAWRIWDSSDDVPLLNSIDAVPPLAFLLWIAAYGPGWLSLDRLITRWWPSWRLAAPAPCCPPSTTPP
jgi:putative oxidoreductase